MSNKTNSTDLLNQRVWDVRLYTLWVQSCTVNAYVGEHCLVDVRRKLRGNKPKYVCGTVLCERQNDARRQQQYKWREESRVAESGLVVRTSLCLLTATYQYL
jgi:orotidine-5'-phosphate decarboxylase